MLCNFRRTALRIAFVTPAEALLVGPGLQWWLIQPQMTVFPGVEDLTDKLLDELIFNLHFDTKKASSVWKRNS